MQSNEKKPTMELDVLNFERLKAKHSGEIQKLVDACTDSGMFFLDLRGPSTVKSMADLEPVIQAQRKFFAQKAELKSKYADDDDTRGYDKFDGLPVEQLKLSREQQLQGILKLPEDLQAVEGKIESVAAFSDSVLRDISKLLCESLDLPIATSSIANPASPGISNMCLGVAAAPAGTSLFGSHRDSDMLTLTYYDEPFMELLERKTQEWKTIEVFDGLPIVNVGKSLQRLSNDRFHAPYHLAKQSPQEINLIMYDLHAAIPV